MMRMIICLALVSLCWQIKLTNSRTSTLWRLNKDSGKITGHATTNLGNVDSTMLEEFGMPVFDASADVYAQDEIFYIIASTLALGTNAGSRTTALKTDSNNGYGDSTECDSYGWVRESTESSVESRNLKKRNESNNKKHDKGNVETKINKKPATIGGEGLGMKNTTYVDTAMTVDETLNCKPVNYTFFDYLIGVGQRFDHPMIPEPEVAYLFIKENDEEAYKKFDIAVLERRLKRDKREKPRSVQLYNNIGNYWRIIGDARQAIECFRRALAMSPTNSEVLLNLARVLYNLQYLDDAIHLTRRSLELTPPGRSAWQQYLTLGEIFKAYGHFQESISHLKIAAELHPEHEPIQKALRELENNTSSTVHVYTIFIIIALVAAVLIVIITTSNNNYKYNGLNGNNTQIECEQKTQRHFNRAMAMRSLKGLSSSAFTGSRNFKHRRY
ncbi:uncharacterized protein [Eurosta solidaginis]|uniref:uncharacterized protein n=1 Tax=Eurosta solidaginis TaxID=178769 RepID=UPI0035315A47